jgi:hemerythrin
MNNSDTDFFLDTYQKDSLIHRNNISTATYSDLSDVDVLAIDSQYKTICQIIKNIAGLYRQYEHIEHQKIPDAYKLYNLLSMLMEYAKIHFVTKEKIWKYMKLNTDLLAISHKNFMESLTAIRGCVAKYGARRDDIKRICEYLMFWFEKHMMDDVEENIDLYKQSCAP